MTTSTPGRRCSHGCKKCFAPCGKSGCGMTLVQCGRQWAASGVGWATSIFRGDGVEARSVMLTVLHEYAADLRDAVCVGPVSRMM